MARIYDVNAYSVGASAYRVTFWSDADYVDIHPLAGAAGSFYASMDAERATKGQADDFHYSYDVQRDGASVWAVWLVPLVAAEGGPVPLDGTNGQPDRRRVIDLGV